jgi:hypothetical protein
MNSRMNFSGHLPSKQRGTKNVYPQKNQSNQGKFSDNIQEWQNFVIRKYFCHSQCHSVFQMSYKDDKIRSKSEIPLVKRHFLNLEFYNFLSAKSHLKTLISLIFSDLWNFLLNKLSILKLPNCHFGIKSFKIY